MRALASESGHIPSQWPIETGQKGTIVARTPHPSRRVRDLRVRALLRTSLADVESGPLHAVFLLRAGRDGAGVTVCGSAKTTLNVTAGGSWGGVGTGISTMAVATGETTTSGVFSIDADGVWATAAVFFLIRSGRDVSDFSAGLEAATISTGTVGGVDFTGLTAADFGGAGLTGATLAAAGSGIVTAGGAGLAAAAGFAATVGAFAGFIAATRVAGGSDGGAWGFVAAGLGAAGFTSAGFSATDCCAAGLCGGTALTGLATAGLGGTGLVFTTDDPD
jgi:hypothetical protein